METPDKVYQVTITRKTIMNVIVLGLIVAALFTLKNLVLVVLTSVVLASFIRTSAETVKTRLGMDRVLSVVLMYLLTLLFFAAVFYFFVPVLVSELSNLLPVIGEYLPKLPVIGGIDLGALGNVDSGVIIAGNQALSGVEGSFQTFLEVAASGVSGTISALFGGILNVVLVVIISFYLSVSRDGIESFLRILTPIEREGYVIDLWKRSQKKIALWMQGQLVLGLLVGILTFLGLSILGVPNAVLLAVVAAIFELIPFGIFLAAIPAISLAFTAGGISLSLMTVALYIIVQQLEGYLIAPLVVHKVTGVSPLVVILSVLVGLSLAGFWGLILAVPVAVTALEYINDLEKERFRQMQNV